MTREDTKVFVLAGGSGTRFWPVSRVKRPKQFLPLGRSSDSLLVSTVRRVRELAGENNLFVVTAEQLAAQVKAEVPDAGILVEPFGRNTAASIGLAAIHAAQENPQTVLVFLPADHAVQREQELLTALQNAIAIARAQTVLVTVGVKPLFPHTGYGYLQRGRELRPGAFEVKRFFEKPNRERAEKYCESGDFYWNTGMFAWRADTILAAIMTCMPALYDGLLKIQRAFGTSDYDTVLKEVFSGLEPVSIDFGVLEHVKNCAVVEAEDFGWNDVGSWDAWAEQYEPDSDGNVVLGEYLAIDSKDCIVRMPSAQGRMVALLGVERLVVIDSGDALLICPRERVQEVKKFVEELKNRNQMELV